MKNLIILSLLLITIVGCKKTPITPNKTNNTVTAVPLYSGTFINSTDINDQIVLIQTTNSTVGGIRYIINGYSKYNKYYMTNKDTLVESQLATYPYYPTIDPNNNACHLYSSTSTVLKVQITYTNSTNSIVTFNKQ